MKSETKRTLAMGGLVVAFATAMYSMVIIANNMRDEAQETPECKETLKKLEPIYEQIKENIPGLVKVDILSSPQKSGYGCVFYRHKALEKK